MLVSAFLYILFIVKPVFYFHHVQSPFILSRDFLAHYLEYPGGISEGVANFIMQSFYSNIPGSIVFLGIAFLIMWLVYELMKDLYTSNLNFTWSVIPLALTVVLANNYNFPFSVIVSVTFVLLLLLLLAKKGTTSSVFIIIYLSGAVIVYYFSGSGYLLLFSVLALLLTVKFKFRAAWLMILIISGFAVVAPLLAYRYIFPVPAKDKYFHFFTTMIFFRNYIPSVLFYIYLLLFPALLIIAGFMSWVHKRNILEEKVLSGVYTASSTIALLVLAFYGHRATCRGDEKKIVASDYYCYNLDAEKTAQAAISLQDYNFAANLNYNLAMSKAGRLSDDFFGFFQMKGTDAVQPDVEFSPEMSFISADFYYDLGFISEARHWAYVSLVYYPYSLRALQLLVKIHLITGEYRAAERCLKILDKGLIGKSFVQLYAPYVSDTTRLRDNRELMEKRSFIPAEGELNPFIYRRFEELLEANKRNKKAYEYLMLYYLLDAQLDSFMVLYADAGDYFDTPVDMYEEAILMYGERKRIPVDSTYNISPATIERYNKFNGIARQYRGNDRLARNALYRDMGTTYLYYLRFIYPRIIKPEIIGK